MIHYGGITPLVAYSLLIPGALVLGLFPAGFAYVLIRGVRRWGPVALLLAPVLWIAFEWARLSVTGQLWNAIGYSQAFHPHLIQVARFGGVYAVSFVIVLVNSAVAYAVVQLSKGALAIAIMIIVLVMALVFVSTWITRPPAQQAGQPTLSVVALQPNVPMDPLKSTTQIQELVQHHLVTSENALKSAPGETPRLLIWPESPMNFSYAMDSQFRDSIGRFAQQQRTFILFNSQEPAPDKGTYNSAVLINEEGRLIAQYDKIRLMPFGEYVPLPQWLPGSNQVRAIVGEFSPGTRYTLMPVAGVEAGVFICIESAYPWIARNFATQGADLLINISNDGYLGPTAVMRQHLANAVFRAVENGRPLLRVTNTGITAYVTSNGEVRDAAPGFETAVRTWTVTSGSKTQTFYTRHGDLFVVSCAVLTLFVSVLTFIRPLRKV
jgi:apolipoprotein N-acyltransferase